MYNNPYFYQNFAKPSLLSKLFGGAGGASLARGATSGINWSSLLSNTQKSLGIINQAIPIIYQVKPIISNAKTIFKIAGAVKNDKPTTTTNSKKTIETKEITTYENKPIFYI